MYLCGENILQILSKIFSSFYQGQQPQGVKIIYHVNVIPMNIILFYFYVVMWELHKKLKEVFDRVEEVIYGNIYRIIAGNFPAHQTRWTAVQSYLTLHFLQEIIEGE